MQARPLMDDSGDSRVRLRDLADRLKLSIGTVSRALHDHPGLNQATKDRVLKLAQDLHYRPNLAARYLSSGRRVRISFNTPREIKYFYDAVRSGLDDGAAPFLLNGIEVEHRMFPKLGVGEREAFEAALDSGVDGIVVVPGDFKALQGSFRRASQMGIPVVVVVTDAPGAKKLASISVNTASSGSLAAELLGRFLGGKGEIAITTGDLRVADHREKTSACERTLRTLYPKMKLHPPIENHESIQEAYQSTYTFFENHPSVCALYISTGNGAPALQAVEDLGLLGKLTIVTTDLFEDLLPRIVEGHVAATFYERPYSQGRIAFRMLHEYLVEGKVASARIELEPLLIMRANLGSFNEAAQIGGTKTAMQVGVSSLVEKLIRFDRNQ